MADTNNTQVVTGLVRFSFVQAFEPRAMEEGKTPKYSVQLIIPKSDTKTVNKIKAAIEAAFESGKAKFGGKLPGSWKNPLRDADVDRPDDEHMAGCYFVNANSRQKPGIVDENLNEIIDPDQLYSGCYGKADVNFYAFNTNGNKGVACGLNNLQKKKDGERLGGGRSAEEAFGQEEEADSLLG